jgi:hypothetical protein
MLAYQDWLNSPFRIRSDAALGIERRTDISGQLNAFPMMMPLVISIRPSYLDPLLPLAIPLLSGHKALRLPFLWNHRLPRPINPADEWPEIWREMLRYGFDKMPLLVHGAIFDPEALLAQRIEGTESYRSLTHSAGSTVHRRHFRPHLVLEALACQD